MTLWIAIIAIGICTYGMRVIPLFLKRQRKKEEFRRAGWLDALGPCLLAAMAAVVILQHIQDAATLRATPLSIAIPFAVVAAVMMIRRDPGLATIGGMLAYFLLQP